MSEITILLYVMAGALFVYSRLPGQQADRRNVAVPAALAGAIGMAIHASFLSRLIFDDDLVNLSIGHVTSMLGIELALIGLVAAVEPRLRGISAGLLILGAAATVFTGLGVDASAAIPLWQTRAHILTSLLAYGVLTGGAIVAVYGLVHNRRLRQGRLSNKSNFLFAPLETTDMLLFGITVAGFAGLAIAILLGLTFVSDIFAQHLVHKTTLALLALVIFGVLIAGRWLAGWRGARAAWLYLAGFGVLCLAYFGSRIVLEEILRRSWS